MRPLKGRQKRNTLCMGQISALLKRVPAVSLWRGEGGVRPLFFVLQRAAPLLSLRRGDSSVKPPEGRQKRDILCMGHNNRSILVVGVASEPPEEGGRGVKPLEGICKRLSLIHI